MSFINSCIENSNANTSKLVRSEITVMSFINSCIENSNANTSKLVRSEITVISLLIVIH
ncbi:MAG: hypothetical protein ACOX24_06350 [Christensenellales bacterium]